MSQTPSAERQYRSEISKVNSGNSLPELINQNDREGITSYFLGEVINIAQKYRSNLTGIDFMDLVGAGNEALAVNLASPTPLHYTTIVSNTKAAIERGIQAYMLKESLNRVNIECDTEKLNLVVDYSMTRLQNDMDKRFLVPNMKETLEKIIIQMRERTEKRLKAFHIVTTGSIDDRIEALIERKREEYERIVHNSVEFSRWFEENEQQNIREIVRGIIEQRIN